MIHDDAGGLLTATIAVGLLAANGVDGSEHIFDTVPISAAITGSLLAGIRAKQNEKKGGRLQWIFTVIAGVAVACFFGPAITGTIGINQLRYITMANFILGLVGSAIVDWIIDNRMIISMWIIRRGVGAKVDDLPVCPADPNVTSATRETKLGE